MQVCAPTTPAQMFHMLRRQMRRTGRKPLVVMTPKSMLRLKQSTSILDDVCYGSFQTLIPDSTAKDPKKVKRVVLCSGKVYYDLLEEARKRKLEDVALLRVEQLYPFPRKEAQTELARYGAARQVVWCQEEPMNQGALVPDPPPPYELPRRKAEAPLCRKAALAGAGLRPLHDARGRAGRAGRAGAGRQVRRRRRRRVAPAARIELPQEPGINHGHRMKVPVLPDRCRTRPSRPGTSSRATRSSATRTWSNLETDKVVLEVPRDGRRC
jgi:hypothetical protein